MNKLRYCGGVLVLWSFLTNAQASNPDVDKFKHSWTAQILQLQREIDINAPLNQATFLGTHNSENSKAYEIPLVRYIDPNQAISIYDQLEMGIRSLEFDVHWYLGAHAKKDILLSHGLPNHVGCSSLDRPVVEGLQELKDWLKANPGEIVVLYFDRTLDGHEPRLTSYVNQYLGEFIYKPSVVRKLGSELNSCVSMPTTLTKNDILNAGKQLLLVAKKCDGTNPHYEEQDQFKLNWNDYVFAGIGDVPNDPYDMLDSKINDFTAYPDCGKEKIFFNDPHHASVWRIFEDRTILANIEHPQRKLLPQDMPDLLHCGINWPTFDMLTVDDERLHGAVWSWAPGNPVPDGGDCAIYQHDKGIQNIPCSKWVAGFACKQEKTHAFKAVNMLGAMQTGEQMCQSLAGKDWHFAAPINAQQMYELKLSAENSGLWLEVGLNYRKDGKGHWQVS